MYSFTNNHFNPPTNGSLMPNPMEPPAYYFLKHPMSFHALVKGLYTFPDAQITEHFRQLNPHLGEGIVRPGEMIVAPYEGSLSCSMHEIEMSKLAQMSSPALNHISTSEAQFMATHYDLLALVAEYDDAIENTLSTFGFATDYFKEHISNIQSTLKKVDSLYQNRFAGRITASTFNAQRNLLVSELDSTLKGLMLDPLHSGQFSYKYRSPNIEKALAPFYAMTAFNPITNASFGTQFMDFHLNIQNYAKKLKAAGYISLALDVVLSALTIRLACEGGGEQLCTYTKYTERGRLAGAIIGGAGGAALGKRIIERGAVSLVLGASGGPLTLMLFAAGVVGGIIGGIVGESRGKATGVFLYELTHDTED